MQRLGTLASSAPIPAILPESGRIRKKSWTKGNVLQKISTWEIPGACNAVPPMQTLGFTPSSFNVCLYHYPTTEVEITLIWEIL